MNDKLTKKLDADVVETTSVKGGKLVATTSSFKTRMNAVKQQVDVDPLTLPNRILLMLDVSGSMSASETMSSNDSISKTRIELLKDAVQSFASRCNFNDTAVAIKTFPGTEATKLVTQTGFLVAYAMGLSLGGGTPLRECMESALNEVPKMTRAVVVSDGQATDWYDRDGDTFDPIASATDKLLQKYVEAKIPVDTVHISTSTEGEERLKEIAQKTGGIFLKFTDVGAFSRAFGYLAPSYRGLLASGNIDAAKLGATEVKK